LREGITNTLKVRSTHHFRFDLKFGKVLTGTRNGKHPKLATVSDPKQS
jgi:hypothetical protein